MSLLEALHSKVFITRVDCKGCRFLNLTGLIALFEILSLNKSVIDLDASPHLIDVDNGLFYFSQKNSTELTTEEISKLQSLLKNFNIKELSLRGCRFTDQTITDICDSIRLLNSSTSVEFRDCALSDHAFMNIISAVEVDSYLKVIDSHSTNIEPRSIFCCNRIFKCHAPMAYGSWLSDAWRENK
ncbi:hypothetical protein GEMRC1_004364 [Eukaryota sp. GEM-RC1]